jgi:hypothetical protein
MGNEQVALQDTQVYKRDHGVHLEKRKKKYDIYGNRINKIGKHDRARYYQPQRFNDKDGYVNSRFFKSRPKPSYDTSNGNPFPATDPYKSNVMPIDSFSPASNPIMDSTSMSGASSAGAMSGPDSVADPTAASNPFNVDTSGGVPNSNPGQAMTANNRVGPF